MDPTAPTRPSTARGTRRGVAPSATKRSSGGGVRSRLSPCGLVPVTAPFATGGDGTSGPRTLYNTSFREGPPGARTVWSGLVGLRHRTQVISDSLVGVETNPGPGRVRRGRREIGVRHRRGRARRGRQEGGEGPGRGRVRRGRRGEGEERRRERTRRRHERRRERRREKDERRAEENERRMKHGRRIVTWNLQNVSMREENRRRLRRVCERIEREGWEIVLAQEISAVGNGIVWLGEGENRVAVIHSVRAGIILRGSCLARWIREGQKAWYYDRVVAVTIGRMRLVSAYQPIWGSDGEALERFRRDLESQLGMGRREKLVIGGDFNANVGRNRRGRDGVYGKFGLGEMNEAGRDWMEWCGTNGLAYVNSYMRHGRRGTWQHPRSGRWYELDGFIVRKEERQRLVRKMKTMSMNELSDHTAKSMIVRVTGKRWRTEGGGGRPPRVKWEALQHMEARETYKENTRERMERANVDEWRWEDMTEVLTEAAKEVCGETTIPVANPWTIGHERELEEMRDDIVSAVRMRGVKLTAWNELRHENERRDERAIAERELDEAKRDVRECRRSMKRRLRRLERDWWQEKIDRCETVCEEGRVGEMYKIMKELGMRGRQRAGRGGMLRANDFKEQFESVSNERYEELPHVIEDVVGNARDLRGDVRARAANVEMNAVPSRGEIESAMKEMKESAPGEDGVRICYIRYACEEMKERVIEMVQKMFVSRANEWSETLKGGVIVPLYKKGDREDPGNYRGVCLLAMGSRILARVIAKRLGRWAEDLALLDENQAGFRQGRSTADVAQMMVRMEEDVSDMKRRVNEHGCEMDENEWPVARLLDLRKAYPRVNKPALWLLLERCGLVGFCLNVIMDLHESTEYKVRANDGMSESWMPERGLREGCSTSPILFNIYHQAVMRQVGEAREAQGSEGIGWKWVPGGSFAGARAWERGGTEAVRVAISSALFADDTSVIGMKGEMDEVVRGAKEVMSKWEERDNAEKEEVLEFGTEEGANVRVLGSWLGTKEDVSNRKRRAGMLWGRVKEWLKGTKLSKRWQARIVAACVESSLLYDSQVRVWYKRDMKSLQQFMDKCYRYVWSDRNGEPLRQMERMGVNMQDVRKRLGVKSVSWKIEKRVLERIGHVVRMGNERLTKVMVFGWYEKLEGTEKMRGRKKKTTLYWKRIMKEAGWDWTEVERLASDRKGWKAMTAERMKHLYEWECQNGHEYEWEANEVRLDRNVQAVNDLECKFEGCGMVCRSRAGLTMHQKRLHRAAEERMRFQCGRCEKVLETEGARVNHERMCRGERILEDGRIECRCGRRITKGNISRHRRGCRVDEVNEYAGMEEEGRREREVNWFVGFEGNDRRGRQLNWFEGFEGNERRGRQLEMNEEVDERMQEVEEVNEGARRDERAADGRIRVGVNEEGEGARGGGNVRGRVGRARGREFIGRRSRCRLCGRTVSYANMARHERTHRVWDPGGGPYPE